MSYLLDALKQSQQADPAQQHDLALMQQQQQQQIKRYRFFAILFGVILAFCVTLFAGFSLGKWLQSNHTSVPNQDSKTAIENSKGLVQEPEKSQPQVQSPALQDDAKVINKQPVSSSVAEESQQYQWVQVPVTNQANALPPQVVVDPVTQQQNTAASTQVSVEPMPAKPTNPSEQLDLSKYKVLGKPMEQAEERKMVEAKQSDELEGVSDNLKNAFAQAVADTDKVERHEVTQGTKRSSYADPIELVPDALHAMLPRIKYQAHIYSSTPDKRWIKLNNRELYEGDSMGDIRLLEITPEQSVLSFDGYEFSLKALQDWPE